MSEVSIEGAQPDERQQRIQAALAQLVEAALDVSQARGHIFDPRLRLTLECAGALANIALHRAAAVLTVQRTAGADSSTAFVEVITNPNTPKAVLTTYVLGAQDEVELPVGALLDAAPEVGIADVQAAFDGDDTQFYIEGGVIVRAEPLYRQL